MIARSVYAASGFRANVLAALLGQIHNPLRTNRLRMAQLT